MQSDIPKNPDLAPRFGLFAFIRKMREDQLSILTPDLFERRLTRISRFPVHYLVINWPEYIEHVLLNNERNYVKGRLNEALIRPVVGKRLLTSEGDGWRWLRRMAAPALHHRGIVGFVDEMVHCTTVMLARWGGRSKPFDIALEMTELVLDIMTQTMFSGDIGDDVALLKQSMRTLLRFDRAALADVLGLPRWVPRARPKGLRRTVAEIDRIVTRILASRRQGSGKHDDLLSMLLAERDETSGAGLTDRQLRDEIMTILFGSHETTANALAFTWYLLATHPEVDARLQQELQHVLAGRSPTYADLARLHYTRMVFRETLRLYPPTYVLNRVATVDDMIGDVMVPKGSAVSIYPYLTHRNPALWPDPDRFDPERFATDRAAGQHQFAYLPFGAGPRICVGQDFATAAALVVIASVAQRFCFSIMPERTVQPIGRLTLRSKDGVWVTAAPRLPAY